MRQHLRALVEDADPPRKGVAAISVATSAASEPAPFLKSTGRVATITLAPGAAPIIAMPAGL
jgi:hypothetical protein